MRPSVVTVPDGWRDQADTVQTEGDKFSLFKLKLFNLLKICQQTGHFIGQP